MIKTPSMQDLLEAGAHFGHQVRRMNPKMKPFIYGARDGVNIIDLAHSEAKLKEALDAIYELGRNGKLLLLVGTKKQAKEIVERSAKEADTPYINSHWIGGLLTNFEEVRKNIKKLSDLKEERDKGELSRYTKREQLLIDRKLRKFEQNSGGIANLTTLPNAIFLVDTVAESTAVREAQRMKVILFGIADTNADPTSLDYPIPANDDGIKSIRLITETVMKAYAEGKKEGGKKIMAEEIRKESEVEELDKPVKEQAEALEEVVEKEIVSESSGKAA